MGDPNCIQFRKSHTPPAPRNRTSAAATAGGPRGPRHPPPGKHAGARSRASQTRRGSARTPARLSSLVPVSSPAAAAARTSIERAPRADATTPIESRPSRLTHAAANHRSADPRLVIRNIGVENSAMASHDAHASPDRPRRRSKDHVERRHHAARTATRCDRSTISGLPSGMMNHAADHTPGHRIQMRRGGQVERTGARGKIHRVRHVVVRRIRPQDFRRTARPGRSRSGAMPANTARARASIEVAAWWRMGGRRIRGQAQPTATSPPQRRVPHRQRRQRRSSIRFRRSRVRVCSTTASDATPPSAERTRARRANRGAMVASAQPSRRRPIRQHEVQRCDQAPGGEGQNHCEIIARRQMPTHYLNTRIWPRHWNVNSRIATRASA